MNKYYLYRHIRLDKNEPFYIGIGSKQRFGPSYQAEYRRAFQKEERSDFWNNIVSKTDYEVEILFECDDYEFIKQKEKEFIKLYGRINPNNGILCNLTDGGDGTVNAVVSEQYRKKNRLAKLGKKQSQETIERRAVKHRGRKNTPETIEKMRVSARKRGVSENHIKMLVEISSKTNLKKVIQFTLNGEFIKEWESIKEATEGTGIKCTGIGACANKKKDHTHAGGFIWRFRSEYETVPNKIEDIRITERGKSWFRRLPKQIIEHDKDKKESSRIAA